MINIVTNPYEFGALKAFIGAHTEFAFDVETTGLNVRSDKVIGFCVATAQQSYYLPIAGYDNASKQILFNAVARDWAVEILQLLQSKRLITWNGAFDLPITRNDFGIDLLPALYIDAMLLYHSCNEEGVPFSHKPFSLKTVAAYFLGGDSVVEAKDLAESIKTNGGSKGEVSRGDTHLVAKYGAKDGLLTMRLRDIFEADAKKQGVFTHFMEEKMVLYREVTIPMEQTGLRLDLSLLQQTQQEISLDLANIEFGIQGQIAPLLSLFTTWFLNKDYPPSRTGAFAQGIAAYYELPLPLTKGGAYSMTEKAIEALPESLAKQVLLESAYLPADDISKIQQLLYKQDHGELPMFNVQSGYHLKKLFFDTLKETPLSRTPTGLPQCNDDFLDSMADKYPWARQLQLHRRLSKLKGTYIDRFIEEQENGRFYASFFQHRTVSNRYGSDIQQMPRKLKLGSDDALVVKYTNLVRDFIIADEGCVLIGADYESLEPHVFAHVSKEPKLIDIFVRGEDDFYSVIGIGAERLTEFSSKKQAANYLGALAKEKRDRIKKYALGIPYGETAYKIQFELGISFEEATFIVDGYWAAHPMLKKSVEAAHAEVLNLGYVTVESGFRRHMPRCKKLYEQYGEVLKDDLKLWKKYHEDDTMYAKAKRDRREFKNYLNNSFNVKIQGLSASIVNRGAIRANREFAAAGLPYPIMMQVHDELVTQVPVSKANLCQKLLRHSMETAYPISVPLKAVPAIGQKYGDLK